MKILMVEDLGFDNGGISSYLINAIEILKKEGHTVKILSSDVNPEEKHSDKNAYVYSDYTFRSSNKYRIIRLIIRIFNPFSYLKTKQILKEFKPDIVHLNNFLNIASPSILCCLKNIPTILTIHDYSIVCPTGFRMLPLKVCNLSYGKNCIKCIGIKGYYYEKIKRKISERLFKNIDLFITPSVKLKKDLMKIGILNVRNIYTGIKLLKYSKLIEGNILLYVGRLSKEKGIKYLLKAMIDITKKVPTAHLNIVGNGPEKKNLEELVKQLKLKNVSFIGQIPHKEIEWHYRISNIIIVPSICEEVFPLVGIEAMSVGRPVIGSRVGGIPEWLDDGKTGFLVDPGNSAQIVEKVIQLFSSRKLMEKMGENGRKKAEQLDINNHMKEIEKVYQEVIGKCKNNK
jgi:glycosyltransferase involved in cell wall biosynthesis